MKKIIFFLLLFTFGAAGAVPTSHYNKINIQGWAVFIYKPLYKQRIPDSAFVNHLPNSMRNYSLGIANAMIVNRELKDITMRVPRGAVQRLQQIPIWIGHPIDRQLGVYHPSREWLIENKMNPVFAGGACFPWGEAFPNAVRDVPSVVLHELAHGYHHKFLDKNTRAQISISWAKNKETLVDWKLQRKRLALPTHTYHPLDPVRNDMEYFAELSSILFKKHRSWSHIKDPQIRNLFVHCWTGQRQQPLTNRANNRILLRRPMK